MAAVEDEMEPPTFSCRSAASGKTDNLDVSVAARNAPTHGEWTMNLGRSTCRG